MTPIEDLIQKAYELFAGPIGPVFISILSLLVAAGSLYYAQRRARIAELAVAGDMSSRRSKFPFYRVSAADLTDEEVQAQLHLTSKIPYVRRLPDDEYERFRKDWFSVLDRKKEPRLLVRGIAGIGKTREVVELLKDYDSNLPDDQKLTILMPRGDFDVPLEPPDDLQLNNLLILVSDLHLFPPKSIKQDVTSGEFQFKTRSLQTRLSQVIYYFEDLCQGYTPLRVVVIARSEPGLWERIHPNASLWRTFKISDLPPLHADRVQEITSEILQLLQLDAEDGVGEILARRNDGTFNSLILYLATEKKEGKRRITEDDALTNFSKTYRAYWEKNIWPMIAQHPEQAKMFEALDTLAQLNIPLFSNLVKELSARLWHTHYPLWLRRVIVRRAIEDMPWITKGTNFLGCPEVYFEGRASLDRNLTSLVDAIIWIVPRLAKELQFMDVVSNFANLIQIPDAQALRIWKALAKVYPEEPNYHHKLSETFYWIGELEKALLESAKALELDPSFKDEYCMRGDILSSMGRHRAAEKFYKAATAMSSREDPHATWIIYERALNLEGLGKADRAVTLLEKVCEIDPTYISARFRLAYRYKKIGSLWEAKYHFDIATNLYTESPITLKNVAKLNLLFGKYKNAIKTITKVIEYRGRIEGFAYELFFLRGVAYVAQGMDGPARKDFSQSARLAFGALRHSHRNRAALSGLAVALVALRKRGAIAALTYALRIDPPITEMEYMLDALQILQDKEPHPLYAKAIQILERKLIAAPGKTPPIPKVLGLLYERGVFENINAEKTPPVKVLQDRFSQLGLELSTQQVDVKREGVRVLMRGVQEFQLIEVDGKPIEGLAGLLNQGIIETWKLVSYVYKTAPSYRPNQEQADTPKSPIEIEVEAGELRAKFTDDQTLVVLSIGEESSEQLIGVINQALEKTFVLAASKLLEMD